MSVEQFINLHWNILSQLFLGKRQAANWLRQPNENFGGSSPAKLIESGRARKVLMWLEAVANGS